VSAVRSDDRAEGNRLLTRAEAVLASATASLAFTILIAYAPYRAGAHVHPFLVLAAAAGATGVVAWRIWRGVVASPGNVAAFVVVGATAALFLAVALPDLLPVGGGPDFTHHLVLINHIERQWRLIDDPALYPYLGDMMDYTPGAHLLIALAGAWTRTAAFRAVQPVLALTVALKAGFIFCLAYRLARGDSRRTATGLIAVALLFVPFAYFAGSFTTHSYWPQVVSELFACASWWAVTVWGDRKSVLSLGLFALFAAATFITWPVFIGPVVLLFLTAVLFEWPDDTLTAVRHLAAGLAPVTAVALLHSAGRSGRLQMAATAGFVIHPSPATLGWVFIAAAVIGLAAAARMPKARFSVIFAATIAAQAVALYLFARWRGANTPYMALKMVYLAIYPLAVAGAVAASARPAITWIAVVVVLAAAAYQVRVTPRPRPIATLAAWHSGIWARDHLDRACIDYLVADGYTGYWLHLAVLDNPRGTPRFDDPRTFNPEKAVERWVDVEGLPYAIVDDERGFSKALFSGTDTVARFGPSIVIRRQGKATCPAP